MEADQNLQNNPIEVPKNNSNKKQTKVKKPKKHSKIFWILIPVLIIATLFSLVAASALIRLPQGTILTQTLDKLNRSDLADISQKFASSGFKVLSQKNIDFKNPTTCRTLWSQMENKNLLELFYGNDNNFSFAFDASDSNPNPSLNSYKLVGEGALKIDTKNSFKSSPLKIDLTIKNKDNKEYTAQVNLDNFESPNGLFLKPSFSVAKFPTESAHFQIGLNNYYDLFKLDIDQALKQFYPNYETEKSPQIEQTVSNAQIFYDSYKDFINIQSKVQLNFYKSKLNTMMTAQTGQDLLEFLCSNIDNLEAQPIQNLDENSKNKTLRPFKVKFSPDLQAKWEKALPDLSNKFAQDKVFRNFLWSNIDLVEPETDDLVANIMQFTITSLEANMQTTLDIQNQTDDLSRGTGQIPNSCATNDRLPNFKNDCITDLNKINPKSPTTKVSICDLVNNPEYLKNASSGYDYKQYLDQYRKFNPDLPQDIQTSEQFTSYIIKRYLVCDQGKSMINKTALAQDSKIAKNKLKEDFLAFEIKQDDINKFYSELFVKSKESETKNNNSKQGTSISKNDLMIWMDYSDNRMYAVTYDFEGSNIGLDPSKIIPDGEIPLDSQSKVKFNLKFENLNNYNPNLKLQEPADSKTLNDLIDVVYSQYNAGKK